MQTFVPEVMDLSDETEATLKAYGVDGGSELRGRYARNCILARRLLERGVGVVQLFIGCSFSRPTAPVAIITQALSPVSLQALE